MNCPTLLSLLEFTRHQLSQVETAEISAHLSTGCSHCRENQQWLTDVVRLKVEDQSFDAPEDLVHWLVAQFRVQAASFASQPSKLRRLLASLVFDNLTAERLVGVRSELAGVEIAGPRRLLYHVEGYDIDLRFERAKGAAPEELVGQVLPEQKLAPPIQGFTIRLLKDELEIASSQTDANGMFVFAQVPTGAFDLKIETSDEEIFINQVSAGR